MYLVARGGSRGRSLEISTNGRIQVLGRWD